MGHIRFAIRSLCRTPVFTIVTTVSLALGLTLTASTVSVVNAYLERSLPYPDAARLYHVMYAPSGPWEPRGMSGLDWTSLADVAPGFYFGRDSSATVDLLTTETARVTAYMVKLRADVISPDSHDPTVLDIRDTDIGYVVAGHARHHESNIDAAGDRIAGAEFAD